MIEIWTGRDIDDDVFLVAVPAGSQTKEVWNLAEQLLADAGRSECGVIIQGNLVNSPLLNP